MEWGKVIEWLVPIVTASLAGLLAIYKMRQNIRFNAKLKWKEEFRSKLNTFINICNKISTKAILAEKNSENEIFKKDAVDFIDKIEEFDAAFYSLDLLMYEYDSRVKELTELRDEIRLEAFDVINGIMETQNFTQDLILNFYYKAKDLYNDDKYILKSI